MDEVDILSDRIGILNNGELVIVGDKTFISQKFGEGYTLIIRYDEKTIQFKEEITTCLKNCQLIGTVIDKNPFEQSIQVQTINKSSIQEVMDKILLISSVNMSIQINSLEQTFDKLDTEHAQQISSAIQNNKFEYPIPQSHKLLFFKQTIACFKKKYYSFIQSETSLILVTIPILAVTTGPYLIGTTNFNTLLPSMLMKFIVIEFIQMQLIASLCAIAFCTNLVNQIEFPVSEKQFGLKQIQDKIGCSRKAYWTGIFLFDFAWFLCLTIIMFGSCYVFNLMLVFKYFFKTMLALMSFSFYSLIHTYVVTFCFRDRDNAVKIFPMFSFFVEFVGSHIIISILQFHQKSTESDILQLFIDTLHIVFTILCPPFGFYQAYLFVNEKFSFVRSRVPHQVLTHTEQYCYIMWISAIAQLLLLVYLERKYNLDSNQQDYHEEQILDDDVRNEKQRALESDTDKIKAKLLRKVYAGSDQEVLQEITFGLHQGEILGLIGPNGAGKSTLLNIIGGIIQPTSGRAFIEEQIINIGICPQYNNLQENMTCRQHLHFLGQIKGLNNEQINSWINYYLQNMNLAKYEHVKSKNLSGGNKRKLCVANALIGGCKVGFFDEPSTGVDSISKKLMFNIMNDHANQFQSTFIISTHRIAEIENMCNHIAILFSGQFICFGGQQQVKDKYKLGFKVSVLVVDDQITIDLLQDKVNQELQIMNCYKSPIYWNKILIQLGQAEQSFYRLFKIFNRLVSENVIQDFEIEENSIESIFIHLSELNENSSKQTSEIQKELLN